MRAPHYDALLSKRPTIGFLEAHPENYMGEGGAPHRALEKLREIYPLAFHGVGLSLVSSEELDKDHLARLKKLVKRYRPALLSEHLAWSSWEGRFFNDLLPVPLTEETLALACRRVEETQEALEIAILVENPSLYAMPRESRLPESEFLAELSARTGCGILLDANNVFVSASNLGFDAEAYMDSFPVQAIGEIHLAGHSLVEGARIDDHGSKISDEVWNLCRRLLARTGPRPLLIEWDKNLPPLEKLLDEAGRASRLLSGLREAA